MGIDDLQDYDSDQGGQSCIVGIAASSLSSLVCIVFLAVDIFSREGLLRHFCIRPVGIVDFTLACITCLLWFAETVYAIHDVVVTTNTFDKTSTPLPTYFQVAAAFFCIFSGLSVLIWVSRLTPFDIWSSSKLKRRTARQSVRLKGSSTDRQTDVARIWSVGVSSNHYSTVHFSFFISSFSFFIFHFPFYYFFFYFLYFLFLCFHFS